MAEKGEDQIQSAIVNASNAEVWGICLPVPGQLEGARRVQARLGR